MNAVIESDKLVKRFGKVLVVDQVSLHVEPGEIYGFLGLNGAGKTTTIRLLLGMIKPDSGEARVLGSRIHSGELPPWASVGYMVETPEAYPELTVRENLEIMRRLRSYGNPGAVSEIIEKMDLASYADRRTSTLSHGNAQRLGIAKALLHHPKLLILDEPANGLDPAGIVEIRNLLTDLAHEQGVTIFMSSHILAEISRLADRIGIIHNGRLLQEYSIEQLEHHRKKHLLVRVRDGQVASAFLKESGMAVAMLADGTIQIKDENAIAHPDEIAERLVRAGCPPTMLFVEQEDLEHYFLRLIGMEGEHTQ